MMNDRETVLFLVISIIVFLMLYLVKSRRYKLLVVFVVGVLIADFYYTFKMDKLVFYNYSKQTKYKPS